MTPTRTLSGARRVLVIGCSGAGKSTFAAGLQALTGLPLVHLDAHYWRPGWEPVPEDEWREWVRRRVQEAGWIIDGNFGSTLDIRLAACDAVVLFDLPTLTCLSGVIRRWIRSARTDVRIGAPPGCPEKFDLDFLHWIAMYRWRSLPVVERALTRHGEHVPVFRLTSRRQAQALLHDLGAAATPR